MKEIICILFICLFTTSCANSSKFTCKEALGAYCVPLSRVDQMVDSGEIEKYYDNKRRSCLFGRCKNALSKNRPSLANEKAIKAQIIDEVLEDKVVREGEYLYVK